MIKIATRLMCVAAVVVFSTNARAQKDNESSAQPPEREDELEDFDKESLDTMSDQEARQAGFVFESDDQSKSKGAATLTALTGGAIFHGLGHWYRGDSKSASKLLALEGASGLLFGLGLLFQNSFSDVDRAKRIGAIFSYLGGGLFGISYLADVVGAYNGSTGSLPTNRRWRQGLRLNAGYKYSELLGRPGGVLQFLTFQTRFDVNQFYASIRTNQELSFYPASYGLNLGFRPWIGLKKDDFLFWEMDLEWYDASRGPSLHRVSGMTRLGLSYDFGHLITHLEGFAAGMAIGYGKAWYGETTVGESWPDLNRDREFFPFESFAHFNITDRLNTRLSFWRRLGVSPSGRQLFDAFTGEIIYRGNRIFDLHVAATAGNGFSVESGLSLSIWK